MTSTRRDVLAARLAELEAERALVIGRLPVPHCGDDADRAANVDEQARLDLLERRIADVRNQLTRAAEAEDEQATIRPGDLVTVDLGDGPEIFRYASVDEADADHDVVTPSSPLGRVLQGAAVGSEVAYKVGGRDHRVRVLAIRQEQGSIG